MVMDLVSAFKFVSCRQEESHSIVCFNTSQVFFFEIHVRTFLMQLFLVPRSWNDNCLICFCLARKRCDALRFCSFFRSFLSSVEAVAPSSSASASAAAITSVRSIWSLLIVSVTLLPIYTSERIAVFPPRGKLSQQVRSDSKRFQTNVSFACVCMCFPAESGCGISR